MNTAIYRHIFLNLEKQRGSQSTIKKPVVDNKKNTNQTHILEHIREFYKTLFIKRKQNTAIEMGSFFNDVDIPKLFENLAKLFEEDLNEKNLYSSLKSMQMTNLQVPMD